MRLRASQQARACRVFESPFSERSLGEAQEKGSPRASRRSARSSLKGQDAASSAWASVSFLQVG